MYNEVRNAYRQQRDIYDLPVEGSLKLTHHAEERIKERHLKLADFYKGSNPTVCVIERDGFVVTAYESGQRLKKQNTLKGLGCDANIRFDTKFSNNQQSKEMRREVEKIREKTFSKHCQSSAKPSLFSFIQDKKLIHEINSLPPPVEPLSEQKYNNKKSKPPGPFSKKEKQRKKKTEMDNKKKEQNKEKPYLLALKAGLADKKKPKKKPKDHEEALKNLSDKKRNDKKK